LQKKGEDLMEIRPLSPQVGAEVIGVDISQPLPDDVFKTIDDAYNHYSVLVFRGQKLTPLRSPEALRACAASFTRFASRRTSLLV
jgi:alpha-ketoglutarate-dependent taurine dioxygenase